MEEHKNGKAVDKVVQCPARAEDRGHCWHSSGAPIQSPTSVLFPSLCCFCAPSYIHLTVYVPNSAPDEDVVASQMQHGHLVTIQKMPKRGPSIAVPRG